MTGVQTCALPIFPEGSSPANLESDSGSDSGGEPPLEASQVGTKDVSKDVEKVG